MAKEKEPIILKDNQIILEEGVDMTHSKFVEWLNENFSKASNKPFNAQDAYGYIKRGNLPYHMGYYNLKEINHRAIGVKIVKVENLNK